MDRLQLFSCAGPLGEHRGEQLLGPDGQAGAQAELRPVKPPLQHRHCSGVVMIFKVLALF